MKKISFDFDDTLANSISVPYFGLDGEIYYSELHFPIEKIFKFLKKCHDKNHDCIILTAREENDKNINIINKFLKDYGAFDMISKVYFTNHKYKGDFIKKHNINIDLHIDDDNDHLESLREHKINGISSLYESCIYENLDI
jgi:hypothetical protein